MEYCNHGDVFAKINHHKQIGTYLKERLIWKILIQTVKGLEAMHRLGIMHRDLKSANIFLKDGGFQGKPNEDDKPQMVTIEPHPKGIKPQLTQRIKTPDEIIAKLGDMNVSKVSNHLGLNYTQTGTPYYASPEVWKDEPYDNKSDVWSLGCVIYEMAALKPPFQANDMQSLYKKMIKGVYPPIPEHFSPELQSLISNMLQVNPRKRMSTEQLVDHSVFKKRDAKYYGTGMNLGARDPSLESNENFSIKVEVTGAG